MEKGCFQSWKNLPQPANTEHKNKAGEPRNGFTLVPSRNRSSQVPWFSHAFREAHPFSNGSPWPSEAKERHRQQCGQLQGAAIPQEGHPFRLQPFHPQAGRGPRREWEVFTSWLQAFFRKPRLTQMICIPVIGFPCIPEDMPYMSCLGAPSQTPIHLGHPTPPPLGSAPVALLRGDSSPQHQGAWTNGFALWKYSCYGGQNESSDFQGRTAL